MAKKESQEGITVKKEDNFSEWYTQVMLKADLADYTSVSALPSNQQAMHYGKKFEKKLIKDLKK
jgi:prolyl-tRNA synthetase